MKDTTFNMTEGSQLDMAMGFMENILTKQHADVPKFVARMAELRQGAKLSYGSTVRRLELELMNVGKVSRPKRIDTKQN